MTCTKCAGLIVTEYDESRCMNCGFRPSVVLRMPEIFRVKCMYCSSPPVVGRKSCQACIVRQAQRSKRRRRIIRSRRTPAAEKEDDDDEPQRPPKRSGDELVALVMRVAQQHPSEQTKETTMSPRTNCSKKGCGEAAAEDSVHCPRHRDMQRAANARYQGRSVPVAEKTTPPATTRRIGSASMAVATIAPQARTAATMRRLDLNGNALTVLDQFIGKFSADLAMLQGAKEILERP
jgi:hypothetical protein